MKPKKDRNTTRQSQHQPDPFPSPTAAQLATLAAQLCLNDGGDDEVLFAVQKALRIWRISQQVLHDESIQLQRSDALNRQAARMKEPTFLVGRRLADEKFAHLAEETAFSRSFAEAAALLYPDDNASADTLVKTLKSAHIEFDIALPVSLDQFMRWAATVEVARLERTTEATAARMREVRRGKKRQ